jgi:hypothetical protein
MSKQREQNYNNHSRLFPLHHFFVVPLTLFFLVGSIYYSLSRDLDLLERILVIVLGLICFTVPFLTRVYALKNQDRIIRLELRQRYFELTGESFLEKEQKLTKGQMIALRFASNDELLPMLESAIKNKTKSKDIKKSIKSWQADYWRV